MCANVVSTPGNEILTEYMPSRPFGKLISYQDQKFRIRLRNDRFLLRSTTPLSCHSNFHFNPLRNSILFLRLSTGENCSTIFNENSGLISIDPDSTPPNFFAPSNVCMDSTLFTEISSRKIFCSITLGTSLSVILVSAN